ncbi:hypothetical protein [Velocimicrobium porci]|uniref:Uncharacterized protein n=1 Tax=Velocimicrobium porci TaxID=2606634 RepID=A0A6L5XUP7_9FIRM|nr:hypothetical protein [Velocimicrobium porci]MSS62432.1 hypothetical protein [Velocimicrobium porci]
MTKKLPPIIIILLVIIYVISIGLVIALEGGFSPLSILSIIVTSIIVGALVATLINRIKEIHEEDDEDLKKY